ncbi:MAG: L-rhamnose mutarotase [Spirochaetota bacterium]
MTRVGFTMRLKPGNEAEYRRRHDELRPELRKELAAHGVRDYTIFLDPESLTLFAFQRLSEPNDADALSGTEVMRRWWEHMADLMEVNEDKSPVVRPLVEVFHVD